MTVGRMEAICACRERGARLDLVGLRVPVAGRPALDDVGDVDVFAREAHGFDDLREQLPGAANKRLALLVFVGARAFPDEHQARGGVADAEHDVGSPRVQLAATAVAKLGAEFGQRRSRGLVLEALRRASRWSR